MVPGVPVRLRISSVPLHDTVERLLVKQDCAVDQSHAQGGNAATLHLTADSVLVVAACA